MNDSFNNQQQRNQESNPTHHETLRRVNDYIMGNQQQAREALTQEAQQMQRSGYNSTRGGEGQYTQYGDVRRGRPQIERPMEVRPAGTVAVNRDFIVPPPPEFRDMLQFNSDRPIPIRPDPTRYPYPEIPNVPYRPGPVVPGQNPGNRPGDNPGGRVPGGRPGQDGGPGGGPGGRPGQERPGTNPGDHPGTNRPGDNPNQPGHRPNDGDNSNAWKWILGAAGAYGAYRFLRNYVGRDDAVNRLSDKLTVKQEEGRTTPELVLKNKKTGEVLDAKTFDGKTFAGKDGKRVEVGDIEVEAKIGKLTGDALVQRKALDEAKAVMKGQLDLQLRGRENLGGLLKDLTVQSDATAPAGSKKFELERGGQKFEVQGATPDGKLKVVGPDGKPGITELAAGEKVVLKVGGEHATVSKADAVTELTKLLGQKSDVEMAKRVAEFAKREPAADIAGRIDKEAEKAKGEEASAIRDAAKVVRDRGADKLDATERMQLAEALRERANVLTAEHQKDYAEGLRKAADAIMPKDVAAEVQKMQLKAAEEAGAKAKATDEAAAKKKAEDEAAAKKKAEDEAAAKKKAEDEAAAKKKAEDEATAKKKAEDEAAAKKKAEDEAAAKKKAEDEAAAKKKAEDEAAAKKKAEDEAAAKKKAEDEAAAKKKAEDEAAAKKKAEDEAAAKKKAEDEAAAKKKAEDEAAAKKKAEDEAAAKKKAEDEAAAKKKAEDEAAAKKKAEDEAAAKKKAEDEAAAKKKAEDEAAAKKKAEDEAAAKKKAEDEAAAKKKAEDEAAAKKKAEDEAAAKKKAEDEAAAKKKAEDEAAAKKKAEEEAAGKKPGEDGKTDDAAQPEHKRRRRSADELSRTETDVRGDGSVAKTTEQLGSLGELAKREKLEKRHVDGMEAYLAKLKQEQLERSDPARQQQIDRLSETISILRGERGVQAQTEANRGIIEAVGKEAERRRGGGAAGMVVSAEILAGLALAWYASSMDKTQDPLDRARIGS